MRFRGARALQRGEFRSLVGFGEEHLIQLRKLARLRKQVMDPIDDRGQDRWKVLYPLRFNSISGDRPTVEELHEEQHKPEPKRYQNRRERAPRPYTHEHRE